MAKKVVKTVTTTVEEKKSKSRKKATKKKPRKKATKKRETKSKTTIEIEKAMIENFVGLQKVLTTNTIKLNELTEKISSLLNIFETVAKELVEKGFDTSSKSEEEILEQVNNLSEQNKLIARGLTLLGQNNNSSQSFQQSPQYPPQKRLQPQLMQSKTFEQQAPRQNITQEQ